MMDTLVVDRHSSLEDEDSIYSLLRTTGTASRWALTTTKKDGKLTFTKNKEHDSGDKDQSWDKALEDNNI